MISVIMPAYNAARFLSESISSILNQTEDNFELIIVNDGSTDNSEEVIMSFEDKRIKYYSKDNEGEGSARNFGLEQARGDHIVWQDADDVSLPMRLHILRETMENVNAGFVHSDMLLIDNKGNPLGYWQSQQIFRSKIAGFLLKIGTPFNNPSMMIRREIFNKRRYDVTIKIGTDTDMISEFAPSFLGIHIPEPLLLYRIHSDNLSSQGDHVTLFSQLKKYVSKRSYEELCPEFSWNENSLRKSNIARAQALVALALARRGMTNESIDMIIDARKIAYTTEDLKFIDGINALWQGDLHNALLYLNSRNQKDHIDHNYIGEIHGLLGETTLAFAYIMESLRMKPNYQDALTNIGSIGMKMGLNLIDNTWNKFSGSKQ